MQKMAPQNSQKFRKCASIYGTSLSLHSAALMRFNCRQSACLVNFRFDSFISAAADGFWSSGLTSNRFSYSGC